jgi:hypothetical protein
MRCNDNIGNIGCARLAQKCATIQERQLSERFIWNMSFASEFPALDCAAPGEVVAALEKALLSP